MAYRLSTEGYEDDWFDPDGPWTADEALTIWEQLPEWTILTDGTLYMLVETLDAPLAEGWRLTCPEEIDATLDA